MASKNKYAQQFMSLSSREQILIMITGLVVIVFGLFMLFLDGSLVAIKQQSQQNQQLMSTNNATKASINELQLALQQDPNAQTKQQIAAYQAKLKQLDSALLSLTSELINPIEMRQALSQLLQIERGVKLVSFEVLPSQKIELVDAELAAANSNNSANSKSSQPVMQADDGEQLTLYKHGIKLKLQGRYFKLRDYLAQLEQLKWKFFWQSFDYQLKAYPNSELEIELYSLSTKREFIGV